MPLERGDVVLVLFPDSNNLATLQETEIDRVIGHTDRMQPVDVALRHTLAL